MNEKIKLIVAMIIVGSIGIFVNYIDLPSSVIACSRAVTGTLFIILVILIKKETIHWSIIKNNMIPLLLSGVALGFNWIFLFEAYNYTTVAVATLCYYMAPVFVIILSPLILREKLTAKKLVCTIIAVCGAILISGALEGGNKDYRGIAFGLAAAVLYCSIIMLNKKITGLGSLEKTLCQLGISAIVMLPYVFCTQDVTTLSITSSEIVLLLIVGIVHTGIIYVLFFSAIGKLPAQTTSVLSYLDPVTAIVLSALILKQSMNGLQICGMILILGATLCNEMSSIYTKKR